MDSAASQPGPVEPKQWGIIDGTFWAFMAFIVPQFALYPVELFIESLATDDNTKQFMAQTLIELTAVLILWIVIKYVYKSNLKALGLNKIKPSVLSWALVALPLYFLASTVVTSIVEGLSLINLDQKQEIGYSDPDGAGLVFIFVALVCWAPFVEELLFRGFLFRAFRRTFGFWVGAAAVSLLFALAHGQLSVGIDVFVLSMFLCYLREKTNSLWPAIALHALKNLVAFTYLFIINTS